MEAVTIADLKAGDRIKFRHDASQYTISSIRKCTGAPSASVIHLVGIAEGITVSNSMKFILVSTPREERK